MLEIPESHALASQCNEWIRGKTIARAEANRSPHRWAWYFGEPGEYGALLRGRTIGDSRAWGGMLEIDAEGRKLLFADGASLRYSEDAGRAPAKNQLYIEFADGSALTASVQMYGGVWAFRDGEFEDNGFYRGSREKASPLDGAFTWEHFCSLIDEPPEKLSAKAFLATRQRVPGLGNGVLQDILLEARVHPKRKLSTLSEGELRGLYEATRRLLSKMTDEGGRDTERDLLGRPGGYRTRASKNTLGTPCPACGSLIEKQNYMGGAVYFCPGCQKL